MPDKIPCQSSKNLFIESLTQVHSVAGVSDKTFATINIIRITNSYHCVDILAFESCLYTIRYLTGKLLLISDARERRWDQLFGISGTLVGSAARAVTVSGICVTCERHRMMMSWHKMLSVLLVFLLSCWWFAEPWRLWNINVKVHEVEKHVHNLAWKQSNSIVHRAKLRYNSFKSLLGLVWFCRLQWAPQFMMYHIPYVCKMLIFSVCPVFRCIRKLLRDTVLDTAL